MEYAQSWKASYLYFEGSVNQLTIGTAIAIIFVMHAKEWLEKMRTEIAGETPEQGRVIFDVKEMEEACNIVEKLIKELSEARLESLKNRVVEREI